MAQRILIAEDDESIATLLEFLMRRIGHETLVVRNGARVMETLEEFRPHLVVLDVMLPVKSGLEICRAIRADTRLRGTRVLLLTAKGALDDVTQGLASGADEYVVKPFSTHDLVSRVQALLEDRLLDASPPGSPRS